MGDSVKAIALKEIKGLVDFKGDKHTDDIEVDLENSIFRSGTQYLIGFGIVFKS